VHFRFEDAVPVLSRTPAVLRLWLEDLSPRWTEAKDGPGTWSPYDVVGHLIHGERTDWIPRAEHLLRHGEAVPFPSFDRDAMFEASRGRSLGELLDTFEALRRESLARLEGLHLTESDLSRRGLHPELGPVTLEQHLATWVAHDMSHIAQVVRTMARQYTETVGPWVAYLSVLKARS
jgi:DinB superfamily